jgi:hypothetical protein
MYPRASSERCLCLCLLTLFLHPLQGLLPNKRWSILPDQAAPLQDAAVAEEGEEEAARTVCEEADQADEFTQLLTAQVLLRSLVHLAPSFTTGGVDRWRRVVLTEGGLGAGWAHSWMRSRWRRATRRRQRRRSRLRS